MSAPSIKLWGVIVLCVVYSFGSKHVSPRSLSAHLLGCLVCVEGIVTKSSLVRPKVVKSVHYCPATGKTMERKYTDLTSLEPFPTSAVYPTRVSPPPSCLVLLHTVCVCVCRMKMAIHWRQNMASQCTETTRPSVSRRPLRGPLQASCLGP